MVSIHIAKGQGLTQALKSYATSQGYDVTVIQASNWKDTIGKLEEIQKHREESNQNSIYTEVKTDKPYANMLVHEGDIEFADAELQALLATMGLEKTKGQEFDAWSVGVSKGTSDEAFTITDKNPETDPDGYVGDFVELTRSYIKEYDADGDKYISFDEIYNKEVATAQANGAVVPSKEDCQRLFDRLNVDNNENSKDKLSEKEIYNYFYTMDNLNIQDLNETPKNLGNDGKITTAEYITAALSLADASEDSNGIGNSFKQLLGINYNYLFGN